MQRVRQFGDLRSSRESKRSHLNETSLTQKQTPTPKRQFDRSSHASSTQSFYVCVNCENLSMSAQKDRQKRDRQHLQRSRYHELEKSRRQFDNHVRISQEKLKAEQKQKVLDSNLKMMAQHEAAKRRQREAVEQDREEQKRKQRESQQQYELNQAEKERRAEDLRRSLERQIQLKNQKRLREEMEDKYQSPHDTAEEERFLELSRRKINDFREGLAGQIRQNEERRRLEKLREGQSDEATRAMLQLAEKRAKEMMTEEGKRRAKYQEQIRQLARSAEKKKQDYLRQKEEERIQMLRDQEQNEKQILENERARTARLQKYRKDIKGQMAEQQKERNRKKMQEKNSPGYLNMTYEQLQKRLCDTCDRLYPKTYMTRYRKSKK